MRGLERSDHEGRRVFMMVLWNLPEKSCNTKGINIVAWRKVFGGLLRICRHFLSSDDDPTEKTTRIFGGGKVGRRVIIIVMMMHAWFG